MQKLETHNSKLETVELTTSFEFAVSSFQSLLTATTFAHLPSVRLRIRLLQLFRDHLNTMKAHDEAETGSDGKLLKILGVTFGIAVTVGGMIGLGILRTPGTVAASR